MIAKPSNGNEVAIASDVRVFVGATEIKNIVKLEFHPITPDSILMATMTVVVSELDATFLHKAKKKPRMVRKRIDKKKHLR